MGRRQSFWRGKWSCDLRPRARSQANCVAHAAQVPHTDRYRFLLFAGCKHFSKNHATGAVPSSEHRQNRERSDERRQTCFPAYVMFVAGARVSRCWLEDLASREKAVPRSHSVHYAVFVVGQQAGRRSIVDKAIRLYQAGYVSRIRFARQAGKVFFSASASQR